MYYSLDTYINISPHLQSMPKYVIPEGPSLTGSLPGNHRGGSMGFGGGMGMGGAGGGPGGMGHGRRYSHFAPAGAVVGRSAEILPGGSGGGENNGSGRTTPSSAQVRTMTELTQTRIWARFH